MNVQISRDPIPWFGKGRQDHKRNKKGQNRITQLLNWTPKFKRGNGKRRGLGKWNEVKKKRIKHTWDALKENLKKQDTHTTNTRTAESSTAKCYNILVQHWKMCLKTWSLVNVLFLLLVSYTVLDVRNAGNWGVVHVKITKNPLFSWYSKNKYLV